MGQADYKTITPPHSLINILDYSNPKALGDHLMQLMKNDTEYLSYFWWKEFYEVNQNKNIAFCKLCQMLNDAEQVPKVRDNLDEWWSTGAQCKPKGSHPWSRYRPVVEGRWRR